MDQKHSPLPWALDEDGFICDANGAEIMHHYHDEAVIEAPDSAFIVRACNSHEQLVAALRDAREAMRAGWIYVKDTGEASNKFEAAGATIDAALTAAGAA